MTTSSNANAPRLGASGKFKAVCAVLAALAVAGIAAWVYQLMGGLGVTGMNNGTSWGLYIAMFMFFVGLSAGGLIVAEGTPEQVAEVPGSFTGQYLKPLLEKDAKLRAEGK